MKEKIVLVSPFGKRKIVDVGTDYALLITGIFGLGWVKLFIDGRSNKAIINMLLLYTGIGTIIHAIILAMNPTWVLEYYLMNGYKPATKEDEEKVKYYYGDTPDDIYRKI